MAIIGIDIGTSGCKVCAFNLSGDIISSASRKYSENRGHGTREIDPDVVREKVFQAISETASACPNQYRPSPSHVLENPSSVLTKMIMFYAPLW